MIQRKILAVSTMALAALVLSGAGTSNSVEAQSRTVTFQVPVVLENAPANRSYYARCRLYEGNNLDGAITVALNNGDPVYAPPEDVNLNNTSPVSLNRTINIIARFSDSPGRPGKQSYSCYLISSSTQHPPPPGAITSASTKVGEDISHGPGSQLVVTGGLRRDAQGIYWPAPLGWTPQNNSTNPNEGNQINLQTQTTTIINNSGGIQ